MLSFALVLLISTDSFGQLNAGQIRRKNRKIGQYRGSQKFGRHFQYQAIGFSVNAMNYFGEVAPRASFTSTDIKYTRPGFSIYATHRYGPRWTAEASYTWGTISADDFTATDPSIDDDLPRYIRNISFRNRISELSFSITADLKKNHATYTSRVGFTPFAFAGLALIYHNPQGKVNENSSLPEAGEWVKLRPLGTEGQYSEHYAAKPYSRLQVAIPFGIGVRYRLTSLLDLSLKVGVRWLFTDYIDDVSGSYVDLGALDSDLAKAMSDRSMETTALNGEVRDFERIMEWTNPETYVSKYDGQTYTVWNGFGSDNHSSNIRGNKNYNDIITSLQIRIAYILGGSVAKAKYR